MGKKKQMPRYYGKNIAQNAQRAFFRRKALRANRDKDRERPVQETDAKTMRTPRKPSETGFVGRGGTRELAQFSPGGGNGASGLCDDDVR